jgi:hypothetical protein
MGNIYESAGSSNKTPPEISGIECLEFPKAAMISNIRFNFIAIYTVSVSFRISFYGV